MSRCYCLSSCTDVHRAMRTTSAMVVLYSTTVLQAISHCIFSLTTLPVHCCSTIFTGVTSLPPSPTLVTLLAERTYISEYYCWYVSLQCYETEIKRRCEVRYVPQCYKKCAGKVIRHTNNLKLPTELPFVEFNTTMALAILTEQRDFVGEGVGQSCGCETALGDKH